MEHILAVADHDQPFAAGRSYAKLGVTAAARIDALRGIGKRDDDLSRVDIFEWSSRSSLGGGSRVVKSVFAAGCVSWKASIGVGDGTKGGKAPKCY